MPHLSVPDSLRAFVLQLEILAHRGWWLHPDEKNGETALRRAFAAGYGIETDLRDCNGEIVVSHDMPQAGAMTLDALLRIYVTYSTRPTLALNIKADGLADAVRDLLANHAVERYFVFDMSVPDTLGYLARGMTVFTRRSEFETGSTLDGRAAGRWLDAFEAAHVAPDLLVDMLDAGAAAALVSPELHGKPHLEAWHSWRDALAGRLSNDSVMLCTDLPDAAASFFQTQGDVS